MKLYIGNLSWNTGEQELYDAFAAFGDVREARVITDRETGRSRGFGFVTFEDSAQAEAAIAEMDGKEVDGRALKVNEARERAPRERSYSRSW